MPLVRFELKNEYGLGDPRLYQSTSKKDEDPRDILSGVAVSGLVGILRQLGDLAEFAAVVFHDVHQQVRTTAARGHKILNCIQKIETTLPHFEKAVQEQQSHIHFAYISGCDWHANIQTSQTQLLGNDLPNFMVDSYEECRDPPRLHLLDKFDSAGAGACLKRYSDPSYFRLLKASSEFVTAEKVHKGNKVQKKKRQRSRGMGGLSRHSINTTMHGRSSMLFSSSFRKELSISVDDASISDALSTSGFTAEFSNFTSAKRADCLEMESVPSSVSKELYDDISATDSENTLKVDCIINSDNKATANKYVMQDSLHQCSDDPFSSLISCETTEMLQLVNQTHEVPKDRIKNLDAVEIKSIFLKGNHLTENLGMQVEHNSRSLTWDERATDNMCTWAKSVSSLSSFTASKENKTDDSEMQDNGVSSMYLAVSYEKAELIEPACSEFADDYIPYRPIDPDLFRTTPETSNPHSELDDTETHNHENALLDTVKMTAPFSAGVQVNEPTCQLDKHMDASNALYSKAQKIFEYHTGKEVLLLPYPSSSEMECDIIKTRDVITSFDGVGGVDAEIAHEACALSKQLSPQVIIDHMQSYGSSESAHRLHHSVENAVSECPTSSSSMKNNINNINSPNCLGVIMPILQYEVIQVNPPKQSSFLEYFGDTFAKTVGGEVLLREHQIKKKMDSTADSNCLGTESQSITENVISVSNSNCLDSETCVSLLNSTPCSVTNITSIHAVVIDGHGIQPYESHLQDSICISSAKTACEKEVFCEYQTKQEMLSRDDSKCELNNYLSDMEVVISSLNSKELESETLVESFSNASEPAGVIISGTGVVVADWIPHEESLLQDSFGDASAETANEKVMCEHQTKDGAESMADFNSQETEYQRSTEKVMSVSIFNDPDSETLPEESLLQNSFGDASAETVSEKVTCEHLTKDGTELVSDYNCQESEYQRSTEKVIAASIFNDPDFETHIASCGFSNYYASQISCGLKISDATNSTSLANVSTDATMSRSPVNVFLTRNVTEDPYKNIISSQLSNASIILPSDASATTVDFQGFPVDSRKSLINIWSNGGLLGLEPSKPPDINSSTIFDIDGICNDRSAGSPKSTVLGSKNELKKLFLDSLEQNSMCKISDEQSYSMPSKQQSKNSIQTSSFCKLDKTQNNLPVGTASEIGVQGIEGTAISSEADVYSENEAEFVVSEDNNVGISVGFSCLAHKSVVNSLRSKSSIAGFSPSSEQANDDVQKLHGSKIYIKDFERPKLAVMSVPVNNLRSSDDYALGFSETLVSPIVDSSECQSPPLEHMKASFEPMNNTDASKLKLEFFSQQRGHTGDKIFPSFQLLTESFHPLLDGALDSDDDIFCRSCPYSSDDLLTLNSDSDAEIWGDNERDAYHKI